MHVVVNHLHFRDPVTEATITASQDAVDAVVAAGGLNAQVAQVTDTHLMLILTFATADDAGRIAREVGGPWMNEHIRPLLAGDTDRNVGAVVAHAVRET